MSEIYAVDIVTRDDVFKVTSGDFISHNGLRVVVKKIVVAMGGDVCVEGVVVAYSSEHRYNLYYGDLVFWGSKGIAKNLTDYLNRIFYARR